MSKDNLGSKQTIVSHNCLFKIKRYDLVITLHRQTSGYIRSKRQTRKRRKEQNKNIFFKQRFSRASNAVSESDTTIIQKLPDLKYSIDKNSPKKKTKVFF